MTESDALAHGTSAVLTDDRFCDMLRATPPPKARSKGSKRQVVVEDTRTLLSRPVLRVLASLSYVRMSKVQKNTIPLLMASKDVVVEAATGSGKTLAFVIPTIETILKRQLETDDYASICLDTLGDSAYVPEEDTILESVVNKCDTRLRGNQVGAIIISPTRELAQQIYEVIAAFTAHPALQIVGKENEDGVLETKPLFTTQLLTGGITSVSEDITAFVREKPRVLVGTPGRMLEILSKSGLVNCKELDMLILDEADRLLDLGFERQINTIIRLLPKQRRTGLFSATMSDAVKELVRVGLRNTIGIVVKNSIVDSGNGVNSDDSKNVSSTPSTLKIGYIIVPYELRLFCLIQQLESFKDLKCIVYMSTCAMIDYFFKVMQKLVPNKTESTINMFSLHGKMDAKKRSQTYTSFVESTSGVLFCTDVAARGIDVPDVDWVIQFDPPQDPRAFTHRCGRTARIGRDGNAVVYLTESELTYINFLQVRNVAVERIKLSECGINNSGRNWKDIFPSDNWLSKFSKKDASGNYIPPYKVVHQNVQSILSKSRELMEQSLKAFVSWTRAYNEHECKFIFRSVNVNFVGLAFTFGLLQIPRMPELKALQRADSTNKNTELPEGITPISEYPTWEGNLDSIPYVNNKEREEKRQHELTLKQTEEFKEKSKAESMERKRSREKTASWSEKKEQKDRKIDRKIKKIRKKDFVQRSKLSAQR